MTIEDSYRPGTEQETAPAVIGAEQLKKFTQILLRYKAGKSRTESRIIASENWWKLRNSLEERKSTAIGADGGFRSVSGWLHNVIVSKHADAMDSYPEPNILPREQSDRQEARTLSAIVPCILEQNCFEQTYSDAMWQKMKTGTGAYKVVWDSTKHHGLGDISVSQVNLLNLYWEPGVTDIQKSRYFFHTELTDREVLEERYPRLAGQLGCDSFSGARFLYDDAVSAENKLTVIEVYYHRTVEGRNTLQYCRYVGEQVLEATENDPVLGSRGLYDHGKFPYVFDPLFPIEGSPCGYGYVDICRNPQTEIDLLKTSFVKNAMVGATPRYFSRGSGGINEEEFLDLSKPIVHVSSAEDNALRRIEHTGLDGSYISMLDRTIQELRETSGNTETSTGNIQSGVTAASAIAALQEASGKGSRDSSQGAYRAYSRIVELCIELIRQFYDLPRQFRITGELGKPLFLHYTNAGLRPQHQGSAFGQDMGCRMPVFDIRVCPQKRSSFTKVTHNELALQFFKLGFFNPQLADQALLCLDMMEFDGRDAIAQKISTQSRLLRKLEQYVTVALDLARRWEPALAASIAADAAMILGTVPAVTGEPVLSTGQTRLPEQAAAVSREAARPGEKP